jgi:hypothetical protein
MTASIFGWLDYDEKERLRMMEILNLFREKGTQDELGAAQIRDSLSDHFFPGTTTVQSRARYFLFVPWIHFHLERDHVASNDRERQHRILHDRLVDSLLAGGESRGIIGVYARQTLRNLPSGIYWTGLNAWGIRLAGESIERYDELRLTSRDEEADGLVTESGELVSPSRRYWHPGIPEPPEDLFERTTFDLTRDEAEFLQERIIDSCQGTLLEDCLSNPIPNIESAEYPWELSGIEHIGDALQTDIEHARLFALLSEGAVTLYNLMLAELAVEIEIGQYEGQVKTYNEMFNNWADEVVTERAKLLVWDRSAFWNRIRELRPALRPATEHFFDRWIELAIAEPRSLATSVEARNLIRHRERLLKGSLARLHNRGPLERWAGASGLRRMTFRWSTAQSHLVDILSGLEREPGSVDA